MQRLDRRLRYPIFIWYADVASASDSGMVFIHAVLPGPAVGYSDWFSEAPETCKPMAALGALANQPSTVTRPLCKS